MVDRNVHWKNAGWYVEVLWGKIQILFAFQGMKSGNVLYFWLVVRSSPTYVFYPYSWLWKLSFFSSAYSE